MNRIDYESLDEEWIKVKFNEIISGFNAYHTKHQFSPNKAETTIQGEKIKSLLTRGDAEKQLADYFVK